MGMRADVLKPAGAPVDTSTGEWTWVQDPDSGAIVRDWVDDPNTTEDESSPTRINNVPVMARGILDGGIRVAGTTERFDEVYENVDWVKATFPKGTKITKRDRVTNIRNARTGVVIWREEEINGAPPTIFNVMGVTPITDPFSNVLEVNVLLQRAEVQSV